MMVKTISNFLVMTTPCETQLTSAASAGAGQQHASQGLPGQPSHLCAEPSLVIPIGMMLSYL